MGVPFPHPRHKPAATAPGLRYRDHLDRAPASYAAARDARRRSRRVPRSAWRDRSSRRDDASGDLAVVRLLDPLAGAPPPAVRHARSLFHSGSASARNACPALMDRGTRTLMVLPSCGEAVWVPTSGATPRTVTFSVPRHASRGSSHLWQVEVQRWHRAASTCSSAATRARLHAIAIARRTSLPSAVAKKSRSGSLCSVPRDALQRIAYVRPQLRFVHGNCDPKGQPGRLLLSNC